MSLDLAHARQPQRYALRCVDRYDSLLAELPKANMKSCTWTLNAPGKMQFEMSNGDPNITVPKECLNEIQVQLVGPGLTTPKTIWQGYPEKAVDDPYKVTWDCQGLLNYFNHRFVLNASLDYSAGFDQMTIFADLVYKFQHTLAGQDWNIAVASYAASGVTRYLKYDRADHQNALDIFTQFANFTDAVGNPTGFDYDVAVPGYGTGSNSRYFNLYYPRKASPYSSTIILEYGRNVTSYKLNTDGSKLANRVYYTGGSNGDIKFENNFQDDGSRGYYGEWQDVVSQSQENDVNALYQLAARAVYNRRMPVQVPDITAVETTDLLLNRVFTGDIIRVRIKNGRLNIDDNYRITEITWKPGPGNLQLKLARPQDRTNSAWS